MAMVNDPVCGMQVDETTDEQEDHQDATYSFSRSGCRRASSRRPSATSHMPVAPRPLPPRWPSPTTEVWRSAVSCASSSSAARDSGSWSSTTASMTLRGGGHRPLRRNATRHHRRRDGTRRPSCSRRMTRVPAVMQLSRPATRLVRQPRRGHGRHPCACWID